MLLINGVRVGLRTDPYVVVSKSYFSEEVGGKSLMGMGSRSNGRLKRMKGG